MPAHQEAPFEMLMQALRPAERDVDRMPLFQVMFALDDSLHMTAQQVGELTLSPLENDDSVMLRGYDLSLRLAEEAQGLSGEWDYNVEQFDSDAVAAISANFVTILRMVTEEPETQLSTIRDLITKRQEQQQQQQEKALESTSLQKLKRARRQRVR
ncbi:hypothetical protein KFU94_70470 [Chloroflexi bacterium TSY]|nr:hypothetical protein [Chloroflexi bacterium TSY]